MSECIYFKGVGNKGIGFLCWCNSPKIKKAVIENTYPKSGNIAVHHKSYGVSLTVNPATGLTQPISEEKAKQAFKRCGTNFIKCPFYKPL